MPVVSVIIPNYNHAAYLKQRIDSVLNQTFQDFEVIILDDCSTDDSKAVINSYQHHPRVSHVIYNQINSGSTFKQWEKGINLAVGSYIWIAESDDWCKPDLLATLLDGFGKSTDCVLAYAQSYYMVDGVVDKQSSHYVSAELVNGKQYVADYLTATNSIFNASMALFKKDCYYKVSNRYTGFKFCGDWLFWVEIAMQGEVFISGKVLNFFRKHKGDVTGKALASGYNFIEENKILKLLREDGIIDEKQYKDHLLTKYISFLFNRSRFSTTVRSEINASFFKYGNQSYRWFLLLRANKATVFKMKVARRLK